MKTHYGPTTEGGRRVRYWFDRSLRLWTAHVVQTNEDGSEDQISTSMYETERGFIPLDTSAYDYLLERGVEPEFAGMSQKIGA
jgi:hypothetical protein